MDHVPQTTLQVLGNLVIGDSYILEQHSDEFERHLLCPDERTDAVDFTQMLKSLRGALSLRR